MKRSIVYIFASLLLFADLSSGQIPVPTVNTPFRTDLSVGYALGVKNTNFDLGNGADLMSTHYLTPNLGLSADAEMMRVSRYDMNEWAVRVGPTYRFHAGTDFQPFLQAMVGYGTISKAKFSPVKPYRWSGGSVMGGIGAEFRIKGPLFGRLAANIIDDWEAPIYLGRGTVGFSYHFGEDRGR